MMDAKIGIYNGPDAESSAEEAAVATIDPAKAVNPSFFMLSIFSPICLFYN